MFLNCSTCFGRNTAHHQELKNCNCSLWFYIRFWLSHRRGNGQSKTFVKPEAVITVFELLMMGDVSPETCWTIKKHWNNKFYCSVTSCWLFLYDLYYDEGMHELSLYWLHRASYNSLFILSNLDTHIQFVSSY